MYLPTHGPRPITIFESEDPTLDPSAITHALPPRDKLLPGTLSLILYGALVAVLALWPEFLTSETRDAPRLPSRQMNIILDPTFPVPKPVPAGGGHEGKGGVAQAPLTAPALPEAVPIKAREMIPEALTPVLDPLPVIAGGDGRSRGSGPGSGGGTGGGTGWGDGRKAKFDGPEFDYQLKPLTTVRPNFRLGPGQATGDEHVTVRITVEEDGRVSSAKAVGGPEYLYLNAEQNALCWLFEPLAKHGLKGPQVARIVFHYKLRNDAS